MDSPIECGMTIPYMATFDPGTYGVEYGILVSESEDPNDAAPKTTLSICGIFDFSRLVEVI